MKHLYILILSCMVSSCQLSSNNTPTVKAGFSLDTPKGNSQESSSEDFNILIVRNKKENNLITGLLSVNGVKLGKTYERVDLRVKQGEYPGKLRYGSTKGFVQGPWGMMGNEGDFYLEIGEVTWINGKKRSNLMFHGGNKPKHSQGCVMLGAVPRNSFNQRYLPDDHTLRKLRLEFYGKDDPNSCPAKNITITILDPFE